MHNDDVLKATLASVEEGLLSAKEGFEAIQQLSNSNTLTPVLVCLVYCRTTGERFAALKGVLVQEYVERLYPSDKGYHCVYAALLAKDAHEFSEVTKIKLRKLN